MFSDDNNFPNLKLAPNSIMRHKSLNVIDIAPYLQ